MDKTASSKNSEKNSHPLEKRKKGGIFSILSGIRKMPSKQTLRLVSPEEAIVGKCFPFGIDFGSTAIKLLQMGIVDKRPQIVNLIVEELPLELWDKPLERKKAASEILKKIVSDYKIKDEVILALPSSSIQINTVKLPPMPETELDSAVKWEIRQISSIAAEDLAFDYYVFEEKKADSGEIEAIAVSCSKKEVFEQMSMVSEAGLVPLAVDTASLAGVCALIYNAQIKNEEIVLFLEFGCRSCSISIVVKNQICFKRELAVNGASLTESIAKHCGISSQDAERLKQSMGLIYTETDKSAEPAGTGEKEMAVMVNEALWLHLENLIQEIDYTFKYFAHQFTAGRINKFDRIILSGGSANLSHFCAYLNNYLGVAVEIADPLKDILLNPKIKSKFDNLNNLSPRLSVAAGLALRELI